jgi:hypothetical protein
MKNKGKSVSFSKKELISEHRNLVNVLQHPSKKRLEDEAKKRGKELNKYLHI